MSGITPIYRITLVWLLLLAATALSWTIGHSSWFGGGRGAGIAIVIIAFSKIRAVLLEFMEIRNSPVVMRIVSELWVAIICAGIVFFYCS